MAHRHPMLVLVALAILPVFPLQELFAQPLFAGSKRELRGVWIATVMNYDWPLPPTLTPERQRDSLVALTDKMMS